MPLFLLRSPQAGPVTRLILSGNHYRLESRFREKKKINLFSIFAPPFKSAALTAVTVDENTKTGMWRMAVLWNELAARHSRPPFHTEFFRDLDYLNLIQENPCDDRLAILIKMLRSKVLHLLELNFARADVTWFRAMLDHPSSDG